MGARGSRARSSRPLLPSRIRVQGREGGHDKVPPAGGLNDRSVFLPVWKAGGPSSRCPQGRVLLRPLWQTCRRPPCPRVLARAFPLAHVALVSLRVVRSLSNKDSSPSGRGPPYVTSSQARLPTRTPSEVTGGRPTRIVGRHRLAPRDVPRPRLLTWPTAAPASWLSSGMSCPLRPAWAKRRCPPRAHWRPVRTPFVALFQVTRVLGSDQGAKGGEGPSPPTPRPRLRGTDC